MYYELLPYLIVSFSSLLESNGILLKVVVVLKVCTDPQT